MPVIEFDEPTHRYTVDGVVTPSVTQILEAAGISDFSGVPADVLARAAARGTAVHQAAWFDDQDDLDETTLDPAITGYLTAWRKFKADNGVVVKLIEQRIYSPLGYVGTFDRLITMAKHGEVMPDLKTGEESPSWRIQLAAYLKGFHGPQSPKCRRVAVKLRNNGTYTLHWYEQKDLNRDFNVFAAALAVFQFRKENRLI
jgi:hypothetical protein